MATAHSDLFPAGRPPGSGRYGRADRSALARWFWEIDRVLLVLVAALIAIGLLGVAAASPAAAVRYSGAPLHYSFRERSPERGGWLVELGANGLDGVEWLGRKLLAEKAEGRAVLLVSHDPALVERVCDRVVRLGASAGDG